jgi:hypothetical protein
MHKRRTQFAKRLSRWATKAENRGVRTTYELHDRLLSNRTARRHHDRARPALDTTQQRIVDELCVEGFVVLPFGELFPAPARWDDVAAAADAFVAETEDGLRREAEGEETELRRTVKKFLVRKNAWGVDLGTDDLWLRLALDQRLLDVANTYLGMWSKLEYVDLWYTPPTEETDRQSSQRWHRDFNDRHLLKAFVYLSDVDETAGPFEYVPRSFPGGELGDLWPWYPGYDGYPPDEEFARRMEGKRVETFTGPRGTLILCNTSGFHRGGYVTGKARVLATWTYASPAALKALSEQNYKPLDGSAVSALPPPARFAVT